MGWIGYGSVMLGNWFLGSDRKISYILIAVGSLILGTISLDIKRYDFAAVNFSVVLFMARALVNERRKDRYWHSLFPYENRVRWWQIWR